MRKTKCAGTGFSCLARMSECQIMYNEGRSRLTEHLACRSKVNAEGIGACSFGVVVDIATLWAPHTKFLYVEDPVEIECLDDVDSFKKCERSIIKARDVDVYQV